MRIKLTLFLSLLFILPFYSAFSITKDDTGNELKESTLATISKKDGEVRYKKNGGACYFYGENDKIILLRIYHGIDVSKVEEDSECAPLVKDVVERFRKRIKDNSLIFLTASSSFSGPQQYNTYVLNQGRLNEMYNLLKNSFTPDSLPKDVATISFNLGQIVFEGEDFNYRYSEAILFKNTIPDELYNKTKAVLSYYKIKSLLKGFKTSVWKDKDGKFNKHRLLSDSIAGVVLGTAGGLITSTIMKKVQVKNGYEDISCNINGQPVASYGDEFSVGIR